MHKKQTDAATDEIICTCLIVGTPLRKSFWERLIDLFYPSPRQFAATIRARKSKDPEFKWVTTIEDVRNCTISAGMILRLPS
jgi:hypothetical protein